MANSKVRMLLASLFISRSGHFNPVLPFTFCFRPGGKIISQKFFLKFLSLLSRKDLATLRKNKIYLEWLQQYTSQKNSTTQASFTFNPVISILVPTYNTPATFLHEMVESVKNQWYPNWELCIADDSSSCKETHEYLEKLVAENNSKIRVTFRKTNGHICESSNSALELASGEFCALLDHDDLLTENALFEVVKLLNEKPDCDFLYSDEDKTDGNGNFSEPNFKPLWSPDNLLSRNYPGHLGVFKTSLIKEVGGFEKGLEGSQDYDLYLKLTEKAKRIEHLSKILYRWRKHEGSVAMNSGSKPYAYIAAEKALSHALKRRGEEGTVIPLENDMLGYYSVRYKLKAYKNVSIIILSENTKALKRCVASILSQRTYPDFQIIVVSSPASVVFPGDADRLRFLSFGENPSRQLNYAIEKADGEFIVLLDPNVCVTSGDWLEKLAEQVQRSSIGVAGAKLVYPDQTIHHAGLGFDKRGLPVSIFKNYPAFLHHKLIHTINNYPMVSGKCMMFRKDVYQKLHGFDSTGGEIFTTEDFCLKAIQAGLFNIYLPHVELRYFENEANNRGNENSLFMNKWKSISSLYSPHLLCYNSDFIY